MGCNGEFLIKPGAQRFHTDAAGVISQSPTVM